MLLLRAEQTMKNVGKYQRYIKVCLLKRTVCGTEFSLHAFHVPNRIWRYLKECLVCIVTACLWEPMTVYMGWLPSVYLLYACWFCPLMFYLTFYLWHLLCLCLVSLNARIRLCLCIYNSVSLLLCLPVHVFSISHFSGCHSASDLSLSYHSVFSHPLSPSEICISANSKAFSVFGCFHWSMYLYLFLLSSCWICNLSVILWHTKTFMPEKQRRH